jgi:thiamine-phosphate pyrophosphorylase
MFATLNTMWHQFTAAAQRALVVASGWSNRTGCAELEAVPLLVGLLSETECLAAAMLARSAIDIPAVRQKWPELAQVSTPPQWGVAGQSLSREVELALQLARQRLAFLPQPLELATEHILLGLAAADNELSQWLRQRGLDPDELEGEIRRLYGYQCEASADEFSPGVLAGELPHDASGTFSPGTCAGGGSATTTPTAPNQSQLTAGLRVLDAAANRAREGLRVVEDYVRFVLDDRHLTESCKQLRHDLTAALDRIPTEHRLASRETQADVGTVLTTSGEQSRAGAAEILTVNFARLQESLRSLEEFCKLQDASLAAAFKQMRYRTYTLQRAAEITSRSIDRLAAVRLYVLIDGRRSVEEFERLARSLIDAGVQAIQLRDKQLGDRELLDRARLLRRLTSEGPDNGPPPLMIVNDRPDLAALARADGVHVGQDELTVKDARSIVGPKMLIGVSTHSIEQARQAVLDGANYIGVGPTFPSGTKTFAEFPGVALLRQVAAEIRLPGFAIGGINGRNLGEVLAAGFTRIAVSGAITAADDPTQTVGEFLALLSGNDE